jgi:hypothetical protein
MWQGKSPELGTAECPGLQKEEREDGPRCSLGGPGEKGNSKALAVHPVRPQSWFSASVSGG